MDSRGFVECGLGIVWLENVTMQWGCKMAKEGGIKNQI